MELSGAVLRAFETYSTPLHSTLTYIYVGWGFAQGGGRKDEELGLGLRLGLNYRFGL